VAGLGGTNRVRGLPSLSELREERWRALVVGKVRLRAMAPVFWLWTGLGMAVFGVTYWRLSVGELEAQKSAVMAKQRAVKKTLGARLSPFVDQMERFVSELGGGVWQGDLVAPEATWEEIGKRPGVYLRLALDQTKTVEAIRRGATASLHDGFTSCFFVSEAGADPTQGVKCARSADCSSGLLCNEWEVCSAPPRPYNMRLAYRAWRILSGEFVDALRGADNELQVRAQERDLDQVTKVDVPVAIDLLQRSRYATIVLDETPAGGVPAIEQDDPLETVEQRIQRVGHDARVGVWDLSSGHPIVRFRGRAEGRLVMMGSRHVTLSAGTKAAQSRQGNSCALAMEVRTALGSREKSGTEAGTGAAAERAEPVVLPQPVPSAAASSSVLPAAPPDERARPTGGPPAPPAPTASAS
jgi:hypothetical protein